MSSCFHSGIFVSPGLIKLYAGASSGGAPYTQVIQDLAITVIAPLVVGQLCQVFLEPWVKWFLAHVNSGIVRLGGRGK